MGTDDLIDDYLSRLRTLTSWHADPDAVIDEMRDHLLTATEALRANGEHDTAAQQIAIAELGEPEEIATALARGPRHKPAVPSAATTSGGIVAFIASGLWVVYALASFGVLYLYDLLGDNGDPTSSSPLQMLVLVPWASGLLGALVAFFATVMILRARHGGFGWVGRAGLALLALAVPAGFAGWFLFGWGTLLAIGGVLIAVELLGAGIMPRLIAVGIGTGPVVGLLAGTVARLAELGTPDEYGDYPIATMIGVGVGCTVFAAALFRLGGWLTGEQPVDLDGSDPIEPAA